MFYKHRIALPIIIILALIGSAFALPVSENSARAQLQAEKPLEGQRLYIGVANREISLFDRSELGASRLAAMLVRAGAELIILNWDVPIPEDANLVLLLNPVSDYSAAQMTNLWSYVTGGGDLLVLSDASSGFSTRSATVELLWNFFGIEIQPSVLINTDFMSTEPAPDAEGDADAESPTATPEPESSLGDVETIPGLNQVGEHPVLAAVDAANIRLQGACTLQTESLTLTDAEVLRLMETNDTFYGEIDIRTYTTTGEYTFNIGEDIAEGPQLVAAVSENPSSGAKVAVICDADLVQNNFGFSTSPPGSARFLYPDSVQFVLNTIFWLLDTDSPEMTFAEPGPTATPTITPSPTITPTPTDPPSEPAE